jgi:alkyl hydroperoxide reductase subunit D
MGALLELAARIPEPAKDVRLNLAGVLDAGALEPARRWGVAVAAAAAARNPALLAATVADARVAAGDAVVDDALAAAALMAMNNVFYRFRHVVGKEAYGRLPAKLRMNRLARPATRRVDLELYSLAASSINGCEACMRAHEAAVVEAGVSPDQVLDAVRIASVMCAVGVSLEIGSATTLAG